MSVNVSECMRSNVLFQSHCTVRLQLQTLRHWSICTAQFEVYFSLKCQLLYVFLGLLFVTGFSKLVKMVRTGQPCIPTQMTTLSMNLGMYMKISVPYFPQTSKSAKETRLCAEKVPLMWRCDMWGKIIWFLLFFLPRVASSHVFSPAYWETQLITAVVKRQKNECFLYGVYL